ncbi:MAG: carboxylesterase/lipase family protein [Bacteroidales bacterium]|nr:carboxylesterase/lipase family protein [Bacteroidales bacterium]
MKKLLIIAAGAALLLCGCAGNQGGTANSGKGPLTTGDDCIVRTTSGRIMGYNDGGIYTFKGVPYAQAERFMPPQDPTRWDTVLKTQTYGPQAMQSQNMRWGGNPSDYDFGFEFKNEKMSEDCLRLNVWTPALDGKKRAVFVWFHGGGYNSGSAIFLPAQEGRALAEKGDIVVVTVNHRLNILGYIDLTALGGKYAESVNLGQQDLVKALEWIHNNIESFGGDPGCVTIGGQSGGGGKTSTLMAMPSAKGLFHRAIVQSGSTLRQQDPAQSKALGIAVVEELGLKPGPDVDLSKFSYDEIAAAGSRATRRVGGNFSPVVDGKYLIQHPFDPMGAECSKDVPMLIGSNLNEFTYTNNVVLNMDQVKTRLEPRLGPERYQEYLKDFETVYPGQEPKELVYTDFRTRGNVIKQAAAKFAQGGANAYVYLFAWKSAVNDYALSACHGMELPFMFNNIANQREMTGGTPEAYKVADAVSSAWIAFIKTGDPNCKELPKWEPFNPDENPTMVLDNVSELKKNHDRIMLQYQ